MASAGVKMSSGGDVVALMVAPMQIQSVTPTASSDTLNLGRKTWKGTGQRWEIRCGLCPLTEEEAEALFTMIVLADHNRAVYVQMPQLYRAKPKSVTRLFLAADAQAGATQVLLTVEGAMSMGSFVQFAGHPKVYMLSEAMGHDVTKMASIYPPLRKAVTSGTDVVTGDAVEMQAVFDTDTQIGAAYKDGVLLQLDNVSLIEKL